MNTSTYWVPTGHASAAAIAVNVKLFFAVRLTPSTVKKDPPLAATATA